MVCGSVTNYSVCNIIVMLVNLLMSVNLPLVLSKLVDKCPLATTSSELVDKQQSGSC